MVDLKEAIGIVTDEIKREGFGEFNIRLVKSFESGSEWIISYIGEDTGGEDVYLVGNCPFIINKIDRSISRLTVDKIHKLRDESEFSETIISHRADAFINLLES